MQITSYSHIKQNIARIESDIKEIEYVAGLISSENTETRQQGKHSNVVENTSEKLIELRDKRQEEEQKLGSTLHIILKFIDTLDNPILKDIVAYKYIHGYTFEQIGNTLGYSRQRVQQIHKQSNVTKKFDEYYRSNKWWF